MTLTRGTLYASLARRTTAPTAWNVQPLQRHFAEGDDGSGDTATDDATDTSTATDTAAQQDKATEDDTQKDTTDWKAQARKHETRAKENAAAAKELADLKRSKMDDQQKAEAAAKESADRAEKAERRAALAEAAITHGLKKDDLELLDGIPADQIDDRAKKLAARIKATTATSSGGEVGGGRGPAKPASLGAAIGAHYNKQ